MSALYFTHPFYRGRKCAADLQTLPPKKNLISLQILMSEHAKLQMFLKPYPKLRSFSSAVATSFCRISENKCSNKKTPLYIFILPYATLSIVCLFGDIYVSFAPAVLRLFEISAASFLLPPSGNCPSAAFKRILLMLSILSNLSALLPRVCNTPRICLKCPLHFLPFCPVSVKIYTSL